MGLTCVSVHVYAPDLAAAASGLGRLMEAALGPAGYERTEKRDEAERHFITAAAPPWVSVFERTGPETITDELIDLGKQLSAASHCPVLLTSVYDSDAFAFLVFEEGKQVDGYASARGVFPVRVRKWSPAKRASEWRRLFDRPMDDAGMQALTEKGLLFADDLLARLCELVGLTRELAASTPRDLLERPRSNQQEFFFRSRPGSASALPLKQTVGTRSPTLTLDIPAGGKHPISFEINGPAGAFSDPVLELSGSAIDAGLVALADGESGSLAHWALGMEAIRAGDIRTVRAVQSDRMIDGRRTLCAGLQGLSAERFGFPPRKRSILMVLSCLRGLAAGTGEVRAALLPTPAAAERFELRPTFLVEVR